jgi:hypothetical protein
MILSNLLRAHFLCLLTLVLLSNPMSSASVGTSPQTLAGFNNVYTEMLPCAQGCFYQWAGACSYDLVGQVLSCNPNCISWASNDCYCRTDYQSIATSYLSKCVSKSCSLGDNANDITSATNLYDDYCTGLGYTNNVVATTQASTAAQPTTVYVTITVTKSTTTFVAKSDTIRMVAGRPVSWAVGILVV